MLPPCHGFLPTRGNCSILGVDKNLSASRDSVGFGVGDCKAFQANGATMCHHRAFTVYSGSFTWRYGVPFIFHEWNSLDDTLICSFRHQKASSFNEICQLLLPVSESADPSHLCRQRYSDSSHNSNKRLRLWQEAHGGGCVGSAWQNPRNRSEASSCVLRQWLNSANPFPGFVSTCLELPSGTPVPPRFPPSP